MGTLRELRGRYGPGEVEEMRLGKDVALLPGLVNAHTHLELGYLRGQIGPGHFVDWVKRLMELTGAQGNMVETVGRSVAEGIAESIGYGVTTLGDITKQVGAARAILRRGPMRVVSFGEIQAIGSRRGLLEERLAAALDRTHDTATMRIGVSPHAPYTVEGTALRRIVGACAGEMIPLCIHLGELREEGEFLASLGGRIREPYEQISAALGVETAAILDESIPRTDEGPVRWAKEHGLFDTPSPVVLAHVNYADDEELRILAGARGLSVAYCPRTRAFFGHDAIAPHRYREMQEAGIRVALGTDSLASNPDLSLLREAQMLLRRDSADPSVLLPMITRNGAEALGLGGERGTLAPGKDADLCAFAYTCPPYRAEAATILASIFDRAPRPEQVWIRGVPQVGQTA